MKQIILLLMLLKGGQMLGQNMLLFPKEAQPGKGYVQCLLYDSAHKNAGYAHDNPIPPFGWEELLIERIPKHQQFTIELPVFDSIFIKIPVDKQTRMANLPEEYVLVMGKEIVEVETTKWISVSKNKECLSANPLDCMCFFLSEIPPIYKEVQKRVIKATAHQRRYDDRDTVILKQIIEIKALNKIAVEVPPQYEKVFRKTNPYAYYSEWREFLCSGGSGVSFIVFKIQEKLKELGYYHGKLDNVMGEKTKAACIRFQKDKQLPVGSLNLETLKALGVDVYDY